MSWMSMVAAMSGLPKIYILALAGLPYQLISSPVFSLSIRRKPLEPGSDFVAVSQVWPMTRPTPL
jgi:hypothetical protein